MFRERTLSILLTAHALCLALAGCSGGGSAGGDPDLAQAPVQYGTAAHEDILAKVYDPAYRVPDGFYVDERADTPSSFAVYHVKDRSASFELCTDDYDQAVEWEEQDNRSRAVGGHYVDSFENERYFEIIRELSYPAGVGNVQAESSPGFARIFKCASVDRNGVDRNLYDGYGGILNLRPLDSRAVKEFTEYLWQFTYFDTATPKVLDSSTNESDETIEHTLRLAFAYDQGAEQCDRIEVVDWIFRVNKESGEIGRSFEFRFAVEAQRVNGVPEECN